MVIRRTPRDATCDPGTAQTWRTADTHWWDSSQIYGRTQEFAEKARTGRRRQAADRSGRDAPGRPRGGSRLRRRAGDASGSGSRSCTPSSRSSTTRSATACAPSTRRGRTRSSTTRRGSSTGALIAKIHTLDWTPAIIANPTMKVAMKANWWGIAGKWLTSHIGRISSSEEISGIPGSPLDHHGVPYSLTEEFVAVYRMHPLLPDEFTFRSLRRQRHPRAHLPGAQRPPCPTTDSARSRCRTPSTRWASRIQARSRCTTTHASSSISTGPTAS